MSEKYWKLDELATSLSKAHLFIVENRCVDNNGEFYGSEGNPWSQFVLTYNVIEAMHSLGFPLDSPRLSKALDWLKENVNSVEKIGKAENILGNLFLLKSFQYMPGFKERFSEKLATIPSFIKKNLSNRDKAKMLPFMSLDSALFNDIKYKTIVEEIFVEIEKRLPIYENAIRELSYAFYLASKYLEKEFNSDAILRVQKKAAELLETELEKQQDNFSSVFYQSYNCLLNLGRLDIKILKEYELFDDFILLRDWATKYFISYIKSIHHFSKISFRNAKITENEIRDLPEDLIEMEDRNKHLYKTCVMMHALAKSSEKIKELQLSVAHCQLKYIYELFLDPLKVNFSRLRYLTISLLIILLLYVLHILIPMAIENITGNKASISIIKLISTIFWYASGITAIITTIQIFKKQLKAMKKKLMKK